MRSVQVALGAGLTLLAVAIAVTLLHSPMGVAASNRRNAQQPEPITTTRSGTSYCQADETLPRATTAVRISLGAAIGPRVKVIVSSRGRTITGGEQASAWTGWVLTVPLRPLPRTVPGVSVCASFALAHETLTVYGERTPAAVAARAGGRALRGRMWIEYLRPGSRSWASLISTTVRKLGLGRAWSGSWIALLALALLVALTALASRLVLTEMR